MTATNHGIFGSFIAITLQAHPAVAICVAPLSHFLLDAIPHYTDKKISLRSKKFAKILTIDAVLAVVSTLIIAWVWSEIALLIIVCAFLAASPDLMWIYYEYINKPLSKKHLVPRFHSWIQWSTTPQGIIVEIIWFILFFFSLIYVGLK